jgi:hypothetical protein
LQDEIKVLSLRQPIPPRFPQISVPGWNFYFSHKFDKGTIFRLTNTTMDETKIPRRGRLSKDFLTKLDSEGGLNDLVAYVRSDQELDMQFRDNYINIYYNGGCALKVGPQSMRLDPYYFYLGQDENGNEIPKTYIEEQRVKQGKTAENTTKRKIIPSSYPTPEQATAIYNGLCEKCASVLKQANNHDFEAYFNEVKKVVGNWVEHYQRIERRHQHYIACSNRNFTTENNLVVIDIEFAVSTLKPYNKLNGKVPKFDIIAVDKSGQLYAIELKANLAADQEDSEQNVKGHHEDFDRTIGGRCDDNDFVEEMRQVLELKKHLHLIDETATITCKYPVFAIAFSGEKEDKKKFEAKYNIDPSLKLQIVDVDKKIDKKFYLKLK